MANLKPLFSSASAEWETPQELFDQLHAEFGFTLDVCAQPHNAKCANYYTPEQDGLSQPWTGVCWCNPPYGRGVERWVAKAAESARAGATVVMLLPARTDTSWFHRWIWDSEHHRPRPGVEVRFLPGRLRFGGARSSAPFPSIIVVFRPPAERRRTCPECCGTRRAPYTCLFCGGTRRRSDGSKCPRCDGEGAIWTVCRYCGGTGEEVPWPDG